MLQNPFLPAPSAANAWAEGFTKGFTAISSPEPGENVTAEDIDAFNQGVAAGEESARTGVSLGDPCIAASEEHGSHVPGMVFSGVEIGWDVLWMKSLKGGIAGLVVMLIELACTLPVHVRDPEEVLPSLGKPVIDVLRSYGLESMELFCGAGLDPTATDCEIRLSPLFTSLDQARQAALAMNRPQWVVASWRTDQSNSFDFVDFAGAR